MNRPSDKILKRPQNINLFTKYHQKYPSHGYRWLNAKIKLETGLILSNPLEHRGCKYVGIISISKHYKYKKPGEQERKNPPILILENLNIIKPMEVVVSEMKEFWCNNKYYELTLYMDLLNNEIVA